VSAQRIDVAKRGTTRKEKRDLESDDNPNNSRKDKAKPWRNKAYVNETVDVPRLLFELCMTVDERPRTSRRGPKPLRIGDQIQCIVLKKFFGRSATRTVKILEQAREKEYISRTPSSNSLIYYFNSRELTRILHDLIGRSSKPMIPYETWFAFDGTPLEMRDYLDYTGTYTSDRANGHRYIMLQTIAGVKTNIIPAAAVDVCLEQYFHMKHDSQFVEDLVRRTIALGFKLTALWGDKAYDSYKNRQLVKEIGAEDHLTPRRGKGSKKKSRRDARHNDPRMRTRNRVETVFSMIKQIFGGCVTGRNETALINEALSIVLAHNLRVLVHFMYEHKTEIIFEK
jgi:hypothetical protein